MTVQAIQSRLTMAKLAFPKVLVASKQSVTG